jgi:hypothetical protein
MHIIQGLWNMVLHRRETDVADLPEDVLRRKFSTTEDVAVTDDGLKIALVTGGDRWVVDTKLREPESHQDRWLRVRCRLCTG